MKFLYITFLLILCSFPIECLGAENQAGTLSFIPPGIAYNPRDFSVKQSSTFSSSKKQILEDLKLLKSLGFKSLVTYSSINKLGMIPRIAREIGFDGTIIMGIWDPLSHEEWRNAINQIPFVDGYCIGNEGLGKRYSRRELSEKMAKLRNVTKLPVTTTEPIVEYLKGPNRFWLFENSDWIFPFTQPYWAHRLVSGEATEWIITRYDYLRTRTKKTIILKEVGLPTLESEGLTEENQVSFFKKMEALEVPFFYFEAFDQPWKISELKLPEVEAHWGLFRNDGTPKKVVPWIHSWRTN